MQHGFFLTGAISLELAGTTSMKLSEGFTKLLSSVLLLVFYAPSYVVLTLAPKKIEVVGAYGCVARCRYRPYCSNWNTVLPRGRNRT